MEVHKCHHIVLFMAFEFFDALFAGADCSRGAPACKNGCSGHGKCSGESTCECDSGYRGRLFHMNIYVLLDFICTF
jgi:hypothetical protein